MMHRTGLFVRRRFSGSARRVILLGIVLGSASGIAAAEATKKPIAARRPKSAGVSDPKVKPAAYDDSEQPRLDVGSTLNAELDQLQRERGSLAATRSAPIGELVIPSASVTAERDKLKKQLNGLVSELARRPRPEETPAGSGAKGGSKPVGQKRPGQKGRGAKASEDSKSAGPQGPVDPMALGQALFRTGDYEGSLKAFELAKKTVTDPRDRAVIKYLSAACLGKLGNVPESTTLFREVANSKADEVLAECARWQLSSQQWREATTARIAQLRALQTASKTEARDPEAGRPGPEK